MALDDSKDIIQIDATVIAGALIFLTVLYVTNVSNALAEALLTFLGGILGSIIIIPFAGSAIFAICNRNQWAKVMMIGGFLAVAAIPPLLVGAGLDTAIHIHNNATGH